MMPREILATMNPVTISAALNPLAWEVVEDRIIMLDESAVGGVHPDATLIASLVCHLLIAKDVLK